jgi:hypothetical protein
MRFVREFALLLAMTALAVVPVFAVGCNDQSQTNPPASGEIKTDLGKKADTKSASPKPAKKARSADEAGSTTGSLGVKPPSAPANTKQ